MFFVEMRAYYGVHSSGFYSKHRAPVYPISDIVFTAVRPMRLLTVYAHVGYPDLPKSLN